MHLTVPIIELIALREKRAAAIDRMQHAVAAGRESCALGKASMTFVKSIDALEEFIAASSEWRAAYADAVNASDAIVDLRRDASRVARGRVPSGTPLDLTLRLGGFDYRCALVDFDGQCAIEYLCPICDATFMSSRRFASNREGAFRMLAAIYREHHEPLHQNFVQ